MCLFKYNTWILLNYYYFEIHICLQLIRKRYISKIITIERTRSWLQFFSSNRFSVFLLFCIPEDSLWLHDGMSFTTYDNDNDSNGTINCGELFRGGWWYHTCHTANLNGEYGNTIKSKGINWYYWKGFYYSMKEARMMVRKP